MENSLFDVFLPKKRDVMFETAIQAANGIKTLLAMKKECFDEMDLDVALFHKVHPNDPNSPSIYFLDKDQCLIFYPPHSKPYEHSYDDKCKFIEVLSGVVYDANSELKIFKGDRLKIYPSDNFSPYTESDKCVIRVCVGNCNSVWDQICG